MRGTPFYSFYKDLVSMVKITRFVWNENQHPIIILLVSYGSCSYSKRFDSNFLNQNQSLSFILWSHSI